MNKVFGIVIVVLLASAGRADQFSFLWYNDFFAGSDRHFTNGVSFSWMDDTFNGRDENDSNRYSAFMYDIADRLPPDLNASMLHTAGISLLQMMFTPDDTSKTQPQYDDIPYAGYLGLAFFLFEWNDEHYTLYRTEIGVIGPESGAGWLQRSFHRMIGNSEPKGWDTQLGTFVTFNVHYQKGFKTWRHHADNLHMDWFNHAGFQLGSFVTDVYGGSFFRFGRNYEENFNVNYPYLKEEGRMLGSGKRHGGFGWDVSFGLNAEALAYSKILEEARKEGYAVEKNPLNASLFLGVSLYAKRQKVTFFYRSQSPFLKEIDGPTFFGGFKFLFQL